MNAGPAPTAAPARGTEAPRPGRLLRRIAGDRAEERVARVLSFAFLPGGLAFGLLAAPDVIAQRAAWPGWWAAAAFVIAVGPAVAQGLLAFTAPIRTLRLLAGIATAGGLLVQASIPFVVRRETLMDGRAWFIEIASLGLVAACVAFRPVGALVVALAGAVLTAADRLATEGLHAVLGAAQDGAYVLLLVITFTGLGLATLAAARSADEAEAAAEAISDEVAADAARERERIRIDAMVHDRVLATLLSAARRLPGTEALERRDAARALAGLQALLVDGGAEQDLDGEAFAWQVQSLTTELLPEALFHYTVNAMCVLPGAVADAMLGAAEESMRNSRKHAAAENRTVHVEVDADAVTVDVLDDGAGFARAHVPSSRLGIANSIEGRMRATPGGSATVVSRPGVGTRVTLRWVAP